MNCDGHDGRVKKMRCGYTTGSCATAGAGAGAIELLTGNVQDNVAITLPTGDTLRIDVKKLSSYRDKATYSVIKDGGDDIDATDGMEIITEITFTPSEINIDGGIGVGRVTKEGLDQPVGNAAINSVPRKMIEYSLKTIFEKFDYHGGANVIITAPMGEAVAEQTFNPNLGIVGGISILGTTGIVNPMSNEAIISTTRVEMNVKKAEGKKIIVMVPGNYGENFAISLPGVDGDNVVRCSNFIGEALDNATELDLDVLLIGNIGKLVKLAGGIMNTHSHVADCRMEILASNCIMAGGSLELAKRIMECTTTDDALKYIKEENILEPVMRILTEKISQRMSKRTNGTIRTAAIVFSSKYGFLGETDNANILLEEVRR